MKEQGPLGAGSGLGESLGGHHAERETCVHECVAETFGRGDAALHERVESRLRRIRQTVLQRVEGVAFIEIRDVDGVTAPAQLGCEGTYPCRQSLRVVVQHDFGHGLLTFRE